MMLSEVYLSVAFIRPKSRTTRPRPTKIDTEVADVKRDKDTTFKVKRSKVELHGAYCGGLSRSLLLITTCVRSRTLCPCPCTPHAVAQVQPIHALRLRRQTRFASSCCGHHEYSCCMRQTSDVRQYHCFISPPIRCGDIILSYIGQLW